ncbi:DUF726 domain-containing protein [Metarhizium album ARSEF 1941]|uniref:DUF726 domain-containing protein n=1 Tax=Metarhizium album (strain ARSEF 1941) TaxID=1081103 RepID=A0A0B2X6K9_METAS|nr:DUF726 domain-containing protein [Metarhizium album ARSEF 1941]KHO02029.1 DUF726 domain-containing protein [Metarhizium album ARSEF 1941]
MSFCSSCRPLPRCVPALRPRQHNLSVSTRGKPSPADILSKPTWSVTSLRHHPPAAPTARAAPTEEITRSQLHHLLRLAALPLPQTPSEEDTMISTLREQLHFVRAVQRVDTTGVEPLCAIRDETDEARRENTVTLADMRPLLDAEEHVGHYKRPRRVRAKIEDESSEKWHVLGTANRRAGKYLVVESQRT